MATIKIQLDTNYKAKNTPDKEVRYPLVIKVSHRRVAKNIQTGHKLLATEWDGTKLKIRRTYSNAGRANAQVMNLLAIAHQVVEELPKAQLKQMDVYQVVGVIEKAIQQKAEGRVKKLLPGDLALETLSTKHTYFKTFGERHTAKLRELGRFSTAQTIQGTINSVAKFHKGGMFPMTDIDFSFLEAYEAWYLKGKNSVNGLASKLRDIRTLLNLAIRDPKTEVKSNHYCFGPHGYSIRYEPTRKRALQEKELIALREYPLEEGSKIWHCRNYWLLLLNLRGMSFKDFALLRYEENLEGDRVVYRRSKTRNNGQSKWHHIRFTQGAADLFVYYDSLNEEKSGYIFPLLKGFEGSAPEATHKQLKNMLVQVNTELRRLGKLLALEYPLTTYVARHTFASLGKWKGLPIAQLSELMGHSKVSTTEIYLAGFGREDLDNATDLIFS